MTDIAQFLTAERLLEAHPDGIYVTDRDRRIVYWNAAAERLTGWSAGEVVGHSCRDNILSHVDKDGRRLCGKETCPLHQSIQTDTPCACPIIVFGRQKDGGRVPMQVNVAPLRDDEGNVIGGIEVFRTLDAHYRDLLRARDVQRALATPLAPAHPGIAFDYFYGPHDLVGGDYLASAQLPDGRMAYMLADVMGHGVCAALYTTVIHSLWLEHQGLLSAPAKFLAAVNHRLFQITGEGYTFATAAVMLLDPAAGTVTTCGAGHCPFLLFRRDGDVVRIDCSALPLGIIEDTMDYQTRQEKLDPGDALFAFTDGAVEIMVGEGEELGEEGLRTMLSQGGYPKSALTMKELSERLVAMSPGVGLADDLTLASWRIKPPA